MNINKITASVSSTFKNAIQKQNTLQRPTPASKNGLKNIASEFKRNKIESMEDALRYSGYFKDGEIVSEDKFVSSGALPAYKQIEIYLSKNA